MPGYIGVVIFLPVLVQPGHLITLSCLVPHNEVSHISVLCPFAIEIKMLIYLLCIPPSDICSTQPFKKSNETHANLYWKYLSVYKLCYIVMVYHLCKKTTYVISKVSAQLLCWIFSVTEVRNCENLNCWDRCEHRPATSSNTGRFW